VRPDGVKHYVAVMRSDDGSAGRQLRHDDEFRQFAAAFLPTLLRAAYLLLRDIDLAEDVVQGTMLRVFRHWQEARIAPEAYSRKTLINVCRDHWRRQSRRPQEVQGSAETAADQAPSFSRDLEEREELAQALGELTRLQREVLVLRFFLDLSVAETAGVLDVPEGTVKSASHRGLQQLRGLLDPADEEVRHAER
jgi:RNA polymerase sigma-70 factor (sigma-E family)